MYDLDTRKRALTLVAQGFSQQLRQQTDRHIASRDPILAETTGASRLQPCCRLPSVRYRKPSRRPRLVLLPPRSLLGGWLHQLGQTGRLLPRVSRAPTLGLALSTTASQLSSVLARATRYVGCRARAASTSQASASTGPVSFRSMGPARSTTARSHWKPGSRRSWTRHPWEFIRGLIHSDGCRITNWTTGLVRGEREALRVPAVLLHQQVRRHPEAVQRHAHCRRCRVDDPRPQGDPYNVSVAPTGVRGSHGHSRRAEVLTTATSGSRPRRCGGRGPGSSMPGTPGGEPAVMTTTSPFSQRPSRSSCSST